MANGSLWGLARDGLFREARKARDGLFRYALHVLLEADDVHRAAAHGGAHELRLPLRDEALRDDDDRRVGAPSLGFGRRRVAEAHQCVDDDVGAYRRRDKGRLVVSRDERNDDARLAGARWVGQETDARVHGASVLPRLHLAHARDAPRLVRDQGARVRIRVHFFSDPKKSKEFNFFEKKRIHFFGPKKRKAEE